MSLIGVQSNAFETTWRTGKTCPLSLGRGPRFGKEQIKPLEPLGQEHLKRRRRFFTWSLLLASVFSLFNLKDLLPRWPMYDKPQVTTEPMTLASIEDDMTVTRQTALALLKEKRQDQKNDIRHRISENQKRLDEANSQEALVKGTLQSPEELEKLAQIWQERYEPEKPQSQIRDISSRCYEQCNLDYNGLDAKLYQRLPQVFASQDEAAIGEELEKMAQEVFPGYDKPGVAGNLKETFVRHRDEAEKLRQELDEQVRGWTLEEFQARKAPYLEAYDQALSRYLDAHVQHYRRELAQDIATLTRDLLPRMLERLENGQKYSDRAQKQLAFLRAKPQITQKLARKEPLSAQELALVRQAFLSHTSTMQKELTRHIEGGQNDLDAMERSRQVLPWKNAPDPWLENMLVYAGTQQEEPSWGSRDENLLFAHWETASSLTEAMRQARQLAYVRVKTEESGSYEPGVYIQLGEMSTQEVDTWQVSRRCQRKVLLIAGKPTQNDSDKKRFDKYVNKMKRFLLKKYPGLSQEDIKVLYQPDKKQVTEAIDAMQQAGNSKSEFLVVLSGHGSSWGVEHGLDPAYVGYQGSEKGSFGAKESLSEKFMKEQVRKLKHYRSGALMVFSCHSGSWLAQNTRAHSLLDALA